MLWDKLVECCEECYYVWNTAVLDEKKCTSILLLRGITVLGVYAVRRESDETE